MKFDESFRQWGKAGAHKIRKTEGREALQQQERMLRYWREHRPKMWDRLQKLHANAARDLELVLETEMLESAWKISTQVNRSLIGLPALRIIVEALSQDMQATGLRKEQLSTLARQVG
jgi:hypothetical protein